MGIGTRDAFTADVEGFLRDHVLTVRGAWGHAAHGGVGDVHTAAGAPAFPLGGRQTSAGLVAPLLDAYFEKDALAVEPDIFPFSRPKVVVKLDAPGTVAKSLPVYLIPYAGGTGHGVKLPAGPGVAYAVTSGQDGCTVEVSGSAAEPYASHTNVVDQVMANRQTVMKQRLRRLQWNFRQAEGLAAGAPNPAAVNRVQFGHWGGSHSALQRNYTTDRVDVVSAFHGPGAAPRTIKSAYREDRGFAGHRNFRYSIVPGDTSLNPAAVSNAQVVAKREAGSWTFYYQVWSPIEIDVEERDKLGFFRRAQRARRLFVSVVVSWGQLWPHPTRNDVDFG